MGLLPRWDSCNAGIPATILPRWDSCHGVYQSPECSGDASGVACNDRESLDCEDKHLAVVGRWWPVVLQVDRAEPVNGVLQPIGQRNFGLPC